MIFFNFWAFSRAPNETSLSSTSDQMDSSPWRWWNLWHTRDNLIKEWTSSRPITVKRILSGRPGSVASGARGIKLSQNRQKLSFFTDNFEPWLRFSYSSPFWAWSFIFHSLKSCSSRCGAHSHYRIVENLTLAPPSNDPYQLFLFSEAAPTAPRGAGSSGKLRLESSQNLLRIFLFLCS